MRTPLTPDPVVVHGTRRSSREYRCKCSTCRAAVAREQNEYRLRRSANGGQHLKVSKQGAVRRLQALMAIGWQRRELARQSGYKGDAFAMLLLGDRDFIVLETHQRIADLYDRLCMTPGPSAETRRRAAKNGWVPPLGWDDIDHDVEPAIPDPLEDDVDDAVVERVLAGEPRPRNLTSGEATIIIRRALARGMSTHEIRQVYGIKVERYVRVGEAAA